MRQAVLEGLGWDIIRIWSTDFWADAETAMDRVHARMTGLLDADRTKLAENPDDVAVESAGIELALDDEALHAHSEKGLHSDTVQQDALSVAEDDETIAESPELPVVEFASNHGATQITKGATAVSGGPSPYRQADLASFESHIDSGLFFDADYDGVFRQMIRQVVECEAPLPKTALATAIARAHGFKRTGSAILERVETLARPVAHFRQDGDGTVIVWRDTTHPANITEWRIPVGDDYKRPIEDIPEDEIRLAALWLAKEEDVPREVAKVFGFSRLRAPSRARIEAVTFEGI